MKMQVWLCPALSGGPLPIHSIILHLSSKMPLLPQAEKSKRKPKYTLDVEDEPLKV